MIDNVLPLFYGSQCTFCDILSLVTSIVSLVDQAQNRPLRMVLCTLRGACQKRSHGSLLTFWRFTNPIIIIIIIIMIVSSPNEVIFLEELL